MNCLRSSHFLSVLFLLLNSSPSFIFDFPSLAFQAPQVPCGPAVHRHGHPIEHRERWDDHLGRCPKRRTPLEDTTERTKGCREVRSSEQRCFEGRRFWGPQMVVIVHERILAYDGSRNGLQSLQLSDFVELTWCSQHLGGVQRRGGSDELDGLFR